MNNRKSGADNSTDLISLSRGRTVVRGDAVRPTIDAGGVEPVRSELDDWRISLHESGHVIVGRAQGVEVGGVTIVAGPDYGGKTWGPLGNDAQLSAVDDDECPGLCEKLVGLMPGPR